MKNEIKSGAILGYINMISGLLITLFYTPFMLKEMGQSEYGLYSLVTSFIAYLSILDMGFGNAMVRFVSRSKAKKDNEENKINGLFLFLYIIIGIIALMLGIILTLNASIIFKGSLTPYEISKSKILMLILTVNISLSFPLSVFDSYVVANEKYKYLKTMTIIKTLLKPMLMVPLLLLGYKSISMTIVVASLNIFYHIAMLIYSQSKLNFKIDFSLKNIDKKLLKEIIGYSFFIFLSIIVDNVFNNTDQVLLGIICGTVSVSIYSVANQISQINIQFSTIISGLFLPKITKTLEEEKSEKKVSDIFLKVSRIQIYIMMLILFGFIVYGKYFIKQWAGPEYNKAYYIILILIIPSIIPLTQNIGISVIQARNQHQFRSIMYIIIAIVNILISIPLSKAYQGVGAAVGTAFANICGQIIIMNIFYYKKAKLDIPSYWKFFIKMFVQYSILSFINILILKKIGYNLLIFIFGILLFMLIYGVITYINMNKEEKDFVKKFVNKITRTKSR